MSKQQKPRRRKSKQKASTNRSASTQPASQPKFQARLQAAAKPLPQRSLRAFLGLTLLWLGPVFALWYMLGPILLMPVAWLANLVLPGLYPHAFEAVELQAYTFDIVTQFNYSPPGTQLPAGMVAQYVFSLNGLKYGYGLPLLLALILASPTRIPHKLKHFALGFVIIVLVQLWGICFESMIGLIFKSDPSIAMQMNSSALGRELFALGYQLGYLILPAVTPLIVWGLSHHAFLQTLLSDSRAVRPSEPTA